MKTKYLHLICALAAAAAMTACSEGETPTVCQPAVEEMTARTVTIKGLIFAEGSSSVTRAGVCYALQSLPDKGDIYHYEYPAAGQAGVTTVESETKSGMIRVKLTELKMDTMYFARMFAENGEGTTYSYPVRFRIDGALFADSEIKFELPTFNSYLPYHFKSATTRTDRISFGKKANDGIAGNGKVTVDPSVLAAYNQANGTAIEILPQSVYSLPATDWTFTGTANYHDLNIIVKRDIDLPDGKVYGLPLKMQIDGSDKTPTTVVLYHVDDLSGWYTVDRLPNCGEGTDKYHLDPAKRRRYIKRTSATTWKTGYLFRCFVANEDDENAPTRINDAQFITLDPATKKISIMQGDYPVTTELNAFDPITEELHIEYLYRDWADWWTAEKMYNRTGRAMNYKL
jgi:hypothetical protein